MDRLEEELKETSARLGKAEEARKTREKLETTCRAREELLPQVEAVQKTLEQQQKNIPRQEELSRKLSVLEAELLGTRSCRRRRMPALP